MIPVSTPLLKGRELEYVTDCLESGWISSEGAYVSRFEASVAEYTGRRYSAAVSSGTAALELAVQALGIGENDEVILPTFSIISCAEAVIRAGARPVLVDCDPRTFNTNAELIRSRITKQTKAILVVHTYGLPCEMDPILGLAKEKGLYVIEDAAEMLGQTYRGKKCGSFGDVSILSFYANKIVTTGEGGMVLTDNLEIHNKVLSLRNLGFSKDRRFRHHNRGWNYRMTNLQAAVGLAQMEQIDQFITKKHRIGDMYNQGLKDIPHLILPLDKTDYARNIYWVYPIVLKKECGMDAEELATQLHEKGIQTRPFFWPIHEQPIYAGIIGKEKHPHSEQIARLGLYLPSGLGTEEKEILEVCRILKEILL